VANWPLAARQLVYKRAASEILPSDLPRRVLRRGRSADGASTVDRAAVGRKIDGGSMNLRDEDEALKRTGGNAARGGSPARARWTRRFAHSGGTLRAMMRRLGRSNDHAS
jgi:hypothetical protein